MAETSIATLNAMLPAAWLRDSGAWLAMLIEVTGKTVVVVVLALVLCAVVRRAGAGIRRSIWSVALIGLLLLPAMGLLKECVGGFVGGV